MIRLSDSSPRAGHDSESTNLSSGNRLKAPNLGLEERLEETLLPPKEYSQHLFGLGHQAVAGRNHQLQLPNLLIIYHP